MSSQSSYRLQPSKMFVTEIIGMKQNVMSVRCISFCSPYITVLGTSMTLMLSMLSQKASRDKMILA